MDIIEIIFISISLATDAFAVSICKGLSIKKVTKKKITIVAIYFSLFQGIMPIIGYLLGTTFKDIIITIDHWLAFILLSIIGINMLKETIDNKHKSHNDKVDIKTMLPISIATSIDALAIGITLAFLKTNIIFSSITISLITFILTVIGVIIGNKFGNKYEKKAQITGGIILIIIGLKILIEHLT